MASKSPADYRAVRFLGRARELYLNRDSFRQRPREGLRFLFKSAEVSNWTYELENEDELIDFTASLLGCSEDELAGYVAELRGDIRLDCELRETLQSNPRRDDEPRWGFRLMHYCLVRHGKPSVVAEIGVHDGLGAVAVLEALRRNHEQGSDGVLLAFDPNPDAGWVVPERLRGLMIPIVGDVVDTFDAALEQHGIDLVIHDIGIKFAHDRYLFETALRHAHRSRKAPSQPLLIRSEVQGHPELRNFAAEHGGRYYEFAERPRDHFWRGTEIGVALLEPTVGRSQSSR